MSGSFTTGNGSFIAIEHQSEPFEKIEEIAEFPFAQIPVPTLAEILLSAFRYALGKRTYIVSQTVTWLDMYWHIMPEQCREQIHSDIRKAIARGDAGDKCDIRDWQQVLIMPVKEEDK